MPVVRDYLLQKYTPVLDPSVPHQPHKPLSVNTQLLNPPSTQSIQKASPVSPIIARKIYEAKLKPFAEDSDVHIGINDANEEHKFTSYHLDYKYTPPIHKGPCAVCGNFIVGSMVTACEKMYCPGCFLCTNCGVEMKPAYYKVHDERPYCRNCHSQLFLPPCAQCGDYLGEHYVKVGPPEKYYHKACFKCFKCRQPLNPNRYFEKDGQLYCEDDYNNLFKPKCTKCFKPIIDESQGVTGAGGRHFHRHCLSCQQCKKGLNPNNYMEKDGNFFCPDCFHNLYSPKCTICRKPVTKGEPLVVGGRSYHPACFNCSNCHKSLTPSNFKDKNGRLFCPDCFHKLFSPKCTSCKKPIVNGDPAMSKGGFPYHRHCFACDECTKILDPARPYMEKGTKLYCPDCYHELYSTKCASCRKPIITEEPFYALGKEWHPHCFNCTECGRGLSPKNFLEKGGRPYCSDCYHKLFSAKCFGCKQPITSGEIVKALGQTWHPNHFSCSNCAKPMSPSDFKQRNGKMYCSPCFHELFNERCYDCHKVIIDKAIYAMGRYYHPNHFKCLNCKRQLKEGAFFEHSGDSYCENCYLQLFAPKCRGCGNPITNQIYLFALGSNWHDTCFKCTECKCQLFEDTFYEFDGEPYCEEHYHARICPDCIKMRRAVDRYLGKPEGTSSKPDSVIAHRTLNLPLSRAGSNLSLNNTTSETEKMIIQRDHSKQSYQGGYGNQVQPYEEKQEFFQKKNEIHEYNSSPTQGSNWEVPFTRLDESSLNWNWNEPQFSRSNNYPGDYYRRDEAFQKSSGILPENPNCQFESTFKKEICESITRY